jgi:hypothetical protein
MLRAIFCASAILLLAGCTEAEDSVEVTATDLRFAETESEIFSDSDTIDIIEWDPGPMCTLTAEDEPGVISVDCDCETWWEALQRNTNIDVVMPTYTAWHLACGPIKWEVEDDE